MKAITKMDTIGDASMLLGSIEAGGTKFVCAVGNEDYQVQARQTIPTTTPQATLDQAVAYFQQFPDLQALAISSFGPIELRPDAPDYGYITATPKAGWSHTDFLGRFQQDFDCPMVWTTDVNGSAYGETVAAQQAGEPVHSLVYITLGTGVGAGIVIDGHFVGQAGHPEMGHVRVKRHPDDLAFPGICPYHGDCLEGLVSGPTFEARTGRPGRDVPLSDPVWDIMAYYAAQAALQATLLIRPNQIVFGGGVVSAPFLTKVRQHFAKLMNGYLEIGHVDQYLVLPRVAGNGSATLGNFALAARQLTGD